MADFSHCSVDEIHSLSPVLFSGELDLSQLLDAISMGIAIYQADGTVLYFNQAARTLLGYTGAGSLGIEQLAEECPFYIANTTIPCPRSRWPLLQALWQQTAQVDSLDLQRGERRIPLMVKATPLRDRRGTVTHGIATFQEMTPPPTAIAQSNLTLPSRPRSSPRDTAPPEPAGPAPRPPETNIPHHQQRFAKLATATPGILYGCVLRADHTLGFEYLDGKIEQIYEAPLAEIVADPEHFILGQMHPDDRPGYRAALTHSAQTLEQFTYEWRTTSPSGHTRWLQAQAQPERRENGTVCWHGLLLDISDRKQVELDLQEALAQNRAILTAIPDLIVKVNRAGTYLCCVRNNPPLDLLSPECDPIGHHLLDFLPPDLVKTQLQRVHQALETGEIQVYEQQVYNRGRWQYEEVRAVPCGQDEVLLMIRDISDRKAAELALIERETYHRTLISALPDLMFRVSRQGVWLGYVRTNALIDILPETYNPQGHHISDHMPPEIAAQQLKMIQQALDTGTLQIFEQQLQIGDRVQYEEVRIVPHGADEVLFIVRDISDRKAAELALQQSEAENRAIITAIPDLMFRLHRDGTYLAYFRDKAPHDLLTDQENPVGQNITEYATDEFLQAHIAQQLQAVQRALDTGKMQIYEQKIERHGNCQYEEVRIVPYGADEVLVMIRDINDRKAAELALQRSEAQKQAMLSAIPDLMFRLHRDGTFLAYLGSDNLSDILDPEGRLVGHNIAEYATNEALKSHIDQKMQAVHDALETGEVQVYEQTIDLGDTRQYEEVRIAPSGPDEVLVMVRDISDRKQAEEDLRIANERLEKLSFTDALTDIANRRSLDEYLHKEWRRAMRDQQPLSLILFDIDYFKRFNDTYGHQRGDECLIQVAQATRGIVNRVSDMVARYGGEEFAVILANTDLPGAANIAERIRRTILALQIPNRHSEANPAVTVSLGISAVIPPVGSQPNLIIRQADQALYRAKQSGRNTVKLYQNIEYPRAAP